MKLFLYSRKFIFHSKKSFCSFKNSSNDIRNITPTIEEKINEKLYKIPNHPLNILSNKLTDFFISNSDQNISKLTQIVDKDLSKMKFTIKDDFDSRVTTKENFYDLLVDKNNDTVSPKNTYYIDNEHVLRTHMTAHDIQLLKAGYKQFITIGDVYRRDSIDATHYPIFHQVDGVRIFDREQLKAIKNPYDENKNTDIDKVSGDLKYILQNLNLDLFGDVKYRWVDAYFPFTEPSYELEIFFNGDWLEVLGCGILREDILRNAGLDPSKHIAWAFGLGLERLAMRLFDIKDIRLFWSKDKRFLDQFKNGSITKFKSYSKYPSCFKDITFFIDDNFNDNDFFEIVRSAAGDIAEDVKCTDTYTNPTTKRTSKCFRINFRHMDRTVTNEEINSLQLQIRDLVKDKLQLELR